MISALFSLYQGLDYLLDYVLLEFNVSDSSKSPGSEQTLEQSAAREQAKMAKPEYQEVEVVTGEEDESNVFQVS